MKKTFFIILVSLIVIVAGFRLLSPVGGAWAAGKSDIGGSCVNDTDCKTGLYCCKSVLCPLGNNLTDHQCTKSSSGNFFITTSSMPDAVIGQPYHFTFYAAGGTPPYKVWAGSANPWPSGIGLQLDGTINGTVETGFGDIPTATGTRTFTVRVNDATYPHTGGQATKTLTLKVLPASSTPTPLNGACSSTHYTCSVGTSANEASDATGWTWNCNGFNSGTNASCSETKASAVSGACSSPPVHYTCSVGIPGATAEYPSVSAPDFYAYQWWCNSSYEGANVLCTEPKGGGGGGSQVTLDSLTPTSGPTGTTVTVHGSGFTTTGNIIKFGNGYIKSLSSADGTTITFTIPSIVDTTAGGGGGGGGGTGDIGGSCVNDTDCKTGLYCCKGVLCPLGNNLTDHQCTKSSLDNFFITTPSSSSLPDAHIGQPYSVTFQATGGTPPYKVWAFVETYNPMPSGLTLNLNTGILSGTVDASFGNIPTATGTRTFTVRVNDATYPHTGGQATKTFTMKVLP